MTSYADFLARKTIVDQPTGIAEPKPLPAALFSFQADIVRWALRRGRAALFAGTGLGKTFMELSWGAAVAEHTGRPVLHLAPLAVSTQIAREAEKFDMTVRLVRDQSGCGPGINITNYHKIEHFDLRQFGGVVLDESSILKSETGHYRNKLVADCADVPFRLAATATPAPNDFMELGNHAAFLGVMSYTDMLSTFFTHDNGDTQKWRLKGYAENDFWRWMASWSVMLRAPADLGYENGAYNLPPLNQLQHTVPTSGPIAATLAQRITARRETVDARVAAAVDLVPTDGSPCIIWCNLNSEQDALEKALAGRCISIRGAQTDEMKERLLAAWLAGEKPVVIVKPSMFGHGLNFQHCATMIFVGLNDSFEQIYQAVRRCWRFGQTRPVTAHFIAAASEGAVVANIKRKEDDADRMAAAMVLHTRDISSKLVRGQVRDRPDYSPQQPMILPSWVLSDHERPQLFDIGHSRHQPDHQEGLRHLFGG